MDIKELKQKITDNTFDSFPLVLKFSDNPFIANQYINMICKNKNRFKLKIDTLNERILDDDFFDSPKDTIYVYEVENLTETITEDMDDLIVICKNIKTSLPVDFIEIPKLLEWQIEDFAQTRLTGLDNNAIKWLCKICKYDIYRLDNEIKKLEIFDSKTQKVMFNNFNDENMYSDLNDMTIFTFTDAILDKNYMLIGQLIPEIESADLEPLGVVTILLNKFKQIMDLKNPSATASSLGMSDKQFYYLKNHPVNTYTSSKIIDNIVFLSNIDYKIKSGLLDLTREELLAYIIINIL